MVHQFQSYVSFSFSRPYSSHTFLKSVSLFMYINQLLINFLIYLLKSLTQKKNSFFKNKKYSCWVITSIWSSEITLRRFWKLIYFFNIMLRIFFVRATHIFITPFLPSKKRLLNLMFIIIFLIKMIVPLKMLKKVQKTFFKYEFLRFWVIINNKFYFLFLFFILFT